MAKYGLLGDGEFREGDACPNCGDDRDDNDNEDNEDARDYSAWKCQIGHVLQLVGTYFFIVAWCWHIGLIFIVSSAFVTTCCPCCSGDSDRVSTFELGLLDLLKVILATLFLPVILLVGCCYYTVYPLSKWCISSDGWCSKYTMKDVAYFFLNIATAIFFALDTFDMVLDFIEVNKLANLCEHGQVEHYQY